MKKTTDQVRNEVKKLIDELGLGEFERFVLTDLSFNYRLQSFEDEDYSQLGNTRLGGLPDLPKEIDYPYKEEGYYNLLCQINFEEFTNKLGKLPEKGILYIFDGHSSENDFVTFFSESADNLERKFPPKGMKNLNEEYNKSYYDGLKAKFEVEPVFFHDVDEIRRYDQIKYNELMKMNSLNQTHILGDTMGNPCSAYMYLKGFDTLIYDVLLEREVREYYQSQLDGSLISCKEGLKRDDTDKEYLKRKKEQLLKLDSEKEIHFKNYNNVTCLIGLESLDRLGWMWSDSGRKYVYILDEDLEKGNFNNLLVQTWSS